MVRATDFEVGAVQVSMFTPDTTTFSQRGFVAAVLSVAASRYDGNLVSLPEGISPQVDIPRVVLESNDGVWRVHASPARVDAFCSRIEGTLHHTAKTCGEVLGAYVESASATVDRIGLVVTRAAKAENPAELLISMFCNEAAQSGALRRSNAFELHNHKLFALPKAGLIVNSWVRCKTGGVTSDQGMAPAVVVEQDINTPSADHADCQSFSVQESQAFLDEASSEIESILRAYFPVEG